MNEVKFTKTKIKTNKSKSKIYKILIVDDEIYVHKLTEILLDDVNFKNYGFEIISAFSAKEAIDILKDISGISVILLDVVMETTDAGFKVVKFIREELKNNLIRIILRTGQAGYAPQKEVIVKYEIHDYIEKTSSDAILFFTKIVTAIRSYQDMINLQKQEELIVYQSKMAAMGEMLDNIAHQWKQPLSAISASSNLLKMNKELDCMTDEAFDNSIGSIDTSVQHLSQTIDDFRNFFKPNKNKNEFSIKDTLEKTLKLMSAQFLKSDIFEKNIEEVILHGFENELIQVFMNIFSNARDALIKKENQIKLISIHAIKKDNMLEIYIKDNAGGIPNDIIKNIFKSHFTTKEDSGGTGIGLYMSKIIIEEHMQGVISASNVDFVYKGERYVGAEFKITLPMKNDLTF